jgi:hypothetical protein
MFALATVSLTSAQSSVVFSGIPADYTHLQVRALARTDRTADGDSLYIRYNSNSTVADYENHGLVGDGSVASAYAINSLAGGAFGYVASANFTASRFGVAIWDILDYKNTNKNTVDRCLSGAENNAASSINQVRLTSGLWIKTDVVTSITILSANGANIVQDSHFALYGIKAG